jgi:hypothetical protein
MVVLMAVSSADSWVALTASQSAVNLAGSSESMSVPERAELWAVMLAVCLDQGWAGHSAASWADQ